eukprot:3688383-Amphidinium_carterae.1
MIVMYLYFLLYHSADQDVGIGFEEFVASMLELRPDKEVTTCSAQGTHLMCDSPNLRSRSHGCATTITCVLVPGLEVYDRVHPLALCQMASAFVLNSPAEVLEQDSGTESLRERTAKDRSLIRTNTASGPTVSTSVSASELDVENRDARNCFTLAPGIHAGIFVPILSTHCAACRQSLQFCCKRDTHYACTVCACSVRHGCSQPPPSVLEVADEA